MCYYFFYKVFSAYVPMCSYKFPIRPPYFFQPLGSLQEDIFHSYKVVANFSQPERLYNVC